MEAEGSLQPVRHLSLPSARSIQSIPPSHFSNRFNIILPSKLESSKWFPSLRFPRGNRVWTSPLSIRATCYVHLSILDLITRKDTIFVCWNYVAVVVKCFRCFCFQACFSKTPVVMASSSSSFSGATVYHEFFLPAVQLSYVSRC